MDKWSFIKGVNAYKELQSHYDELVEAIMGFGDCEGKAQDALWRLEESLVEGYLGEIISNSDYALEAAYNYIIDCEKFNIDEFDELISKALDDEAAEALKNI